MSNEHQAKLTGQSCWKRRTKLEKCFFLLTAILVLIIIAFLVLTILYFYRRGSEPYCPTTACHLNAAKILQNLNSSVNPCDDFFSFACGNFKNNHILPEYKSSISAATIVGDEMLEKLKSLFEKPIDDSDIGPFVLVKDYYQACMNVSNINYRSLRDVRRVIARTGGWPVLEGAPRHEITRNWQETAYHFMKVGFHTNMFFGVDIRPDPRNSSKLVLQLDQPHTVSFEKLLKMGLNESIVQNYYYYMVDIVTAMGADKAVAQRDMRDVMDLYVAISGITVQPEDQRILSLRTNPMTIQELHRKFNYVDWREFINRSIYPSMGLGYGDIVIVTVPQYFRNLSHILESTPKRTLINYMYWNAVARLTSYLSEDVRRIEQKFNRAAYGVTQPSPKWKECTQQANSLNVASGALYIRNFFAKSAKASVSEMVGNIRYELYEILKTVPWMDEETRNYALEKAQAMGVHIAYPEEFLDDEEVEKYYEGLVVSRGNYLESALNLTLFNKAKIVAELYKPNDKNDWRKLAISTIVNAFYSPNMNSIILPAGILQGIYFDNDRPQYMNYGGIGAIIGHEITHGFDDKGKQYDKDGNLADWWHNGTKAAFDEKAKCIIKQYGELPLPDVDFTINGHVTQGENIADNGGIKEAYLAYKKWTEDHGEEPGMPGLAYTPEQLFWISAANSWCSVSRSQIFRMVVLTGSHTPDAYRVNIPFKNTDYFARDFDCPLGSNMNPESKCQVW